jgi:uncharacterized iron-regulated membrane protein
VSENDPLTAWQRWVRKPQKLWLRRALFQAHLWSGIGLGLYIFTISVTGSVLVYWNELYRAATPEPVVSKSSSPRLSEQQLTSIAEQLYPGYRVAKITRSRNPDQAININLHRGKEMKHRMFDPRSGSDLGDSVSTGMRAVSFLLDLHDNLLAGQTGRTVNGIGAFAVLAVAISGMLIWWPGSKTWRRSLTLHRGVGWKRQFWHLHSMLGFWTVGFVMISALSGIYLCFSEQVQDIADRFAPAVTNGRVPLVDQIIYWLAYLHFGRIAGIGIPCSGPGLCDQATKAVWALFGLAPAAMFVSGAMVWWNRVLRPWMARGRRLTGTTQDAITLHTLREGK